VYEGKTGRTGPIQALAEELQGKIDAVKVLGEIRKKNTASCGTALPAGRICLIQLKY